MSKLISVFTESFKLLFKKPKLFIPKFIMAAVYGILMLLTASLVVSSLDIVYSNSLKESITILYYSIVLLLFSLVAFILDILITSMYSILVKDYYNKKSIKLINSFKQSHKKAFVVIPAIIIYTIIFIVLTSPITLIVSFFLLAKNFLYVSLFSCLLITLIYFSDLIFFLIYPVSVYENISPFSAIRRTIKLSKTNLKDASKASIIPFTVSLISWFIAFLQNVQQFLILFILLRFIIAIISTYNDVLDPMFYLRYKNNISYDKNLYRKSL